MVTYESQVATTDVLLSISVHVSSNISMTSGPNAKIATTMSAAMPAMSKAYSTALAPRSPCNEFVPESVQLTAAVPLDGQRSASAQESQSPVTVLSVAAA